MSEWNIYKRTLDEIFEQVKTRYKNKDMSIFNALSTEQQGRLNILVNNIENQKSVVAVTITSLLKKIVSPEQDIRLHREEFEGGYSGRSLDTNVVTPWLKEHFPRFAPKESGWLTRSIEQPSPFTMDFPGKIRDRDVKNAFLSILNDIEKNSANPSNYLQCLLFILLDKYEQEMSLISQLSAEREHSGLLTIDIVVNMLREHFSMRMSSRLPVIAIYAIYQIFMENIKLYECKKLEPLKTHTTSDRYIGFGDIEIYNQDGTPFEIVEIKHNIPIDKMMVEDVLKKVKDTTIKKYYILTTSEPNFKDSNEEILKLVRLIKLNYGVEIIPNGIFPSLKYYLRFVPDLIDFLHRYTGNLIDEFKKTADIKEFHIERWMEIRKNYDI
ncbi:hypothetical protein [Hydrogenobaculum acidophilum]